MRLLLNREIWNSLNPLPGLELIETYPAFVLVSCDILPADLPSDSFEIISSTYVMLHGQRLELPEGVYRLGEEPHTVLRFMGPLSSAQLEKLQNADVKILAWAPQFGALVHLPDRLEDAAVLTSELPFVAAALPYRAEDCSRSLTEISATQRRVAGLMDHLYDLVCFSREDCERLDAELQAADVEVLARSSSKLRVRYFEDPRWLRDQVGVKLVDSVRAPRLLQAAWSADIGAPDVTSAGGPRGRGQIIAVADTGLDSGDSSQIHEDFAGRVRRLVSWPINDSWQPFVQQPGADDGPADRNSGHGTHVAGLALGDGHLSEGAHAGVAPAAELVFQSIEQFTVIKSIHRTMVPTGYYLSGRPLDLRQLFLQARELGARIHINAWGDPARGGYTDDSYETDMFLHEHPDATILFAAGNDGSDRDGDRLLDVGSLYAPASAKNVIAVGACEGGQAGVGLRGDWSVFDRDGSRFRNREERQDLISGEPERVALISSTGPTSDGRIKPDLCAPGTNLVAPRSRASAGRGWGLASPMPHYMYLGGSSMAAGVAGGAMALLRESWTAELGGAAPSGAALKALMVLGCKAVLRRLDDLPEPRHVAGFGRIWLQDSMPQASGRRLQLYDEKDSGLLAGEQRSYPLRLSTAGDFRAVLCWYDAPGEVLVNDLDLCLVDGQGRRVWGNHPAGEAGGPDRVNSLEVIEQSGLPAGEYRLEVTAFNVPQPPQSYALVLRYPEQVQKSVIPLDALRGIGKVYLDRLQQSGLFSLDQLLALAEPDLEVALENIGMSARRRTPLLANLTLLRSLLGRPAVLGGVPGEMTLARLAEAGTPVGMNPSAWADLRQKLLSLQELFDKSAGERITLAELFN